VGGGEEHEQRRRSRNARGHDYGGNAVTGRPLARGPRGEDTEREPAQRGILEAAAVRAATARASDR
jgi:hypothetical protein